MWLVEIQLLFGLGIFYASFSLCMGLEKIRGGSHSLLQSIICIWFVVRSASDWKCGLNQQPGLFPECQEEWCFLCTFVDGRPVCHEDWVNEFIPIILVIIHVFHQTVAQTLIKAFRLSIALRMVGCAHPVLYFQTLKQDVIHLVAEFSALVRYHSFYGAVVANDTHQKLGNNMSVLGRDGYCLWPLRQVIRHNDDEAISICCCCQGPDEIHPKLGKTVIRWWYRVQDCWCFLQVVGSLTLITGTCGNQINLCINMVSNRPPGL